jgi:hypothetical protein
LGDWNWGADLFCSPRNFPGDDQLPNPNHRAAAGQWSHRHAMNPFFKFILFNLVSGAVFYLVGKKFDLLK